MEIKEIYDNMVYGPAPETAAPAVEFLENHKRSFDLFIGGEWVKPNSKKYIDSTNPSNKEFLAKIDILADRAFEDQCTTANPRVPLVSEIKQILLDSYYGK